MLLVGFLKAMWTSGTGTLLFSVRNFIFLALIKGTVYPILTIKFLTQITLVEVSGVLRSSVAASISKIDSRWMASKPDSLAPID